MQYYGTRLSENISRREPEGYLLCLNVPVARTGVQEYLPEELGLDLGSFSLPGNGRQEKAVEVIRLEEEVFSPETIASFEGMPVTNDHPPGGVDADNIRRLQAGHAHNVRRGSGKESDLLLADLIITDPRLIDAILGGKREISCGYTYELCFEEGRYIQRRIRGNHIAVVEAGRAGPRVSIKDEQPSGCPEGQPGNGCHATAAGDRQALRAQPEPLRRSHRQASVGPPDSDRRAERDGCLCDFADSGPGAVDHKNLSTERRKVSMKKPIYKLLARMAKDGDIESVAEIIEELIDPEPAGAEAPAEPVAVAVASADPDPVVAEEPEPEVQTSDDEPLGLILQKLDQLISLLTPAAPAADEGAGEIGEEISEIIEETVEAVAGKAGDPIEEEAAELVEEILDPEASVVITPGGEEDSDCDTPEKANDAEIVRSALRIGSPALRKLPPKERRPAARDMAVQALREKCAARRGTRKAAASADGSAYAALAAPRRAAAAEDPRELGRRIMAKRNPHYQK